MLYDTLKTKAFVEAVEKDYHRTLVENQGRNDTFLDLIDTLLYKSFNYSYGVTTFYKPPKFGVRKNKNFHSGWSFIKKAS